MAVKMINNCRSAFRKELWSSPSVPGAVYMVLQNVVLLTDQGTPRKYKSNFDDATEEEVSHQYCNTVHYVM